MSFESLQERLNTLQETTAQLRDLIDRLTNLDFQPGSVPLATDEENSVSGELSSEIASTLRDAEEEQELLQEEVEFVRGAEHDKSRLRESVEKFGKELESCRLAFRKARLSAKSNLARAQRLERELLIQSYSRPVSETGSLFADDEKTATVRQRPQRHLPPQYQQSSLTESDQQTVGASSNVTDALRRTHDLIAAELARSEFAHETLTESSAALKQLNESYTSLDTMLANSRDLLGTLLRSQKSDTWYLQTALYMLMVTGSWLLFRRLLYGPMWWLVWLPLRLLFGLGSSAGSAVMHGVSGPGELGKIETNQEEHAASVEGLPKSDLPTAVVQVDTAEEKAMDDVNRIVEAVKEADELGAIPAEENDSSARNTKKRVWEESEVVGGEERRRDEL